MRHGSFNPMDGRRHELSRPEPPVLVGESSRETPALRFHVVRSVRMHPVLAGSVAAVVFVLLVVYALARKPVYTAESLIYVEPLEVRVLTDGSSSGYDPSRYDSYLQQQVQTVERADTLEAAVSKIPAGVWGPASEPAAVGARRLLNSLKVDRVLNSYELGIDVTASTPAAAAAGANAVAAAYLEAGRKDEHARADQRLQLLTEERQRITDDMTEDKTEQATLGKNLGVANPNGASGNPYDLQSEGLRSQLAAAREAHDAVAAQLASVAGQNGNGLETAANEMIVTDAALISAKQVLGQRRAILSDQMAGLTPANPVYRQDLEEIAGIDRAIERDTSEARQRAERQLQDKLRLDLGRTADVEGRLNAQLAQQTAKATGAGPKLQRAAELETDLQRLSTRFATVDDAIRGLQLETGGPGQAHLAMAARVPDSAQPSRSKLILLLALPLALLFGAGAAVVARKRDPKLYLAGDMQEVLGFPPMAVLPSSSEVSPEAYDEFVLRLAGGLEGAYRHGGARSFVFTPVSVGGRAVAMLPQLCKKLRQIGYRAVVVAADELMPGTAKTMESGTHEIGPVRAREGFATTKLERLLEEYDLVLVVTPPLLGSAVAEYTVRSADATILLVESTRTERGELRRAAMLLERLNPQGIGAVLEDLPLQYADPVFRAAVQAADSWPMMPVKRTEKARTSSAVAVVTHKPPAPEIKMPVAPAPPIPVQEEIAEEPAAIEPPYVEEEAEEVVEELLPVEATASPAVAIPTPHAAPVASEVLAPQRLEQAQVYPVYTAPVEPTYAAPLVSAPVVLPPVLAAVQPPMAPMMDEEPVAIPTDFKPVRFHDASVPTPRAEIKYFTEKPLAGVEPEPVRPVVQEPVQHEHAPSHGLLAGEPLDAVETWDWAGSRADAVHEEIVEAEENERFFTPVSAAPAIEASFSEPVIEPVVEPASVALESPVASHHQEEAVVATVAVEPVIAESVETPVSLEAEPTAKQLSWFQRVFGAEDDQPLRVTPEPLAADESTLEIAMVAAEPVSTPVGEDAEALATAVDSHEEFPVETAVHQDAWPAEHSFREADKVASQEIARVEPPIAFEESLWVRGAGASKADGPPSIHFFLDLSPQSVAEQAAENAAPEFVEAQKVAVVPEALEEMREVEALPADHELVAEQHALAVSGEAAAEVEEAAPRFEFADEPVAELVLEQEIEAVQVEDLSARDKSTVGMWPILTEAVTAKVETTASPQNEAHAEPEAERHTEPEIFAEPIEPMREETSAEAIAAEVSAAPHHAAVQPVEEELVDTLNVAMHSAKTEIESPRTEKPAERKPAPFVPFTPSIAPISSGQFPLRTLERSGGQRAGLARAMRQAGIEDKMPVRIPEEHTPLRTGSGLRKAAVRQEAVLRSHVQAAEPIREQPGMSRRWGMLSRFERIGPASETGDLVGADSKNGTDASQ